MASLSGSPLSPALLTAASAVSHFIPRALAPATEPVNCGHSNEGGGCGMVWEPRGPGDHRPGSPQKEVLSRHRCARLFLDGAL